MKANPVSAWAICHWNAGIYVDTVRKTRRESIAAFKREYGVSDAKWRYYSRPYKINRAIRVTVSSRALQPEAKR